MDIQELQQLFELETDWGITAITELEASERTELLVSILPLITPMTYSEGENRESVIVLGNDWHEMNAIFDQYLDATYHNPRPDNFSDETFINSGLAQDTTGELATALLTAGGMRLAYQEAHKIARSEIV